MTVKPIDHDTVPWRRNEVGGAKMENGGWLGFGCMTESADRGATKIPMTKPQIPDPNGQCPKTHDSPQKHDCRIFIGIWSLGFDWDLGLGHWDFGPLRTADCVTRPWDSLHPPSSILAFRYPVTACTIKCPLESTELGRTGKSRIAGPSVTLPLGSKTEPWHLQ
jgi:hypothetical protein